MLMNSKGYTTRDGAVHSVTVTPQGCDECRADATYFVSRDERLRCAKCDTAYQQERALERARDEEAEQQVDATHRATHRAGW